MSIPKLLAIFTALLFGVISVAALIKSFRTSPSTNYEQMTTPLEVELDREVRILPKQSNDKSIALTPASPATPSPHSSNRYLVNSGKDDEADKTNLQKSAASYDATQPLPEANRVEQLFNKSGRQLPIVETITYKSKVSWQKGRPAWLSDYASHYSTSRHFIARSLNGKADYFKQDVAEGDRFNVFRSDKDVYFHLLIDTSRNKLWFYYIDKGANERVLLKTYTVGLGRIDTSKPSGLLSPLGKYKLGSKIAIYKPKMMGTHNNKKIEMVRVFGSRWIPFEEEIEGATAPAAGFGLHGVPWVANEKGELTEDLSSLGKYESDGCIRLATKDIEEIFAIIITRPTFVELVNDFYAARLPGVEVTIN